jgi:parallel beta-helix repeat protein
MTCLLLVAAALVAVLAAAGVGAGAELHVNPGESIQDAINASYPGDTIYVHAGEYCENVDVNKRLTLIGDGADVVEVRAAAASDHVFEVTADYVNISGFKATGSWKAGIYLVGVEHCNITSGNCSNNYDGIYTEYSDNNILINNTANSNNYHGICLYSSSNNTLMNNNASNNYNYGTYIGYSSNNTLMNNNASNNGFGIWLRNSSNNILKNNNCSNNNYDGIRVYFSSNNTFMNNAVSNNYDCGIYLRSSRNDTLTNNTVSNNNEDGICLPFSSNNTLTNNIVFNNGDYGIWLYYSSNNTFTNNIVSNNNDYGIWLWDSSNNILMNNIVSNNYHGIWLYSSSNNNTLTNNIVPNNGGCGIRLWDSSNNTLTDNTMVNDGVIISGYQLRHWNTHSIPANNTVNGKPVYYWKNEIIGNVPQGAGQVILANCTNVVIENQTMNNGSIGIELGFSSYNTLVNNNCSNNCGGIWLFWSSYTTIHHNNLIGNTIYNAIETGIGTNQWDSGSAGNYYSDYNGTDPDGDGIGEDPHPIPPYGTSTDHYPLMHPWTPPQKGDLNGDNQITPADAAIVLAFAAGGSASCDAETLAAADVSGDGQVTSLDVLMILQAAAGNIEL